MKPSSSSVTTNGTNDDDHDVLREQDDLSFGSKDISGASSVESRLDLLIKAQREIVSRYEGLQSSRNNLSENPPLSPEQILALFEAAATPNPPNSQMLETIDSVEAPLPEEYATLSTDQGSKKDNKKMKTSKEHHRRGRSNKELPRTVNFRNEDTSRPQKHALNRSELIEMCNIPSYSVRSETHLPRSDLVTDAEAPSNPSRNDYPEPPPQRYLPSRLPSNDRRHASMQSPIFDAVAVPEGSFDQVAVPNQAMEPWWKRPGLIIFMSSFAFVVFGALFATIGVIMGQQTSSENEGNDYRSSYDPLSLRSSTTLATQITFQSPIASSPASLASNYTPSTLLSSTMTAPRASSIPSATSTSVVTTIASSTRTAASSTATTITSPNATPQSSLHSTSPTNLATTIPTAVAHTAAAFPSKATTMSSSSCVRFLQTLLKRNCAEGCLPVVGIDKGSIILSKDKQSIKFYSTKDYKFELVTTIRMNYLVMDLSIHGNVAVIGAPYDEGGTGAVYVFERNSSAVWEQTMRIVPENHITQVAWFGQSVSLFDEVFVVGAPGVNLVYSYRRVESSWTLESKVVPEDATLLSYGWQVSIVNNTAAVVDDETERVVLFRLHTGQTSSVSNDDCKYGFGADVVVTPEEGLLVGCADEGTKDDAGAVYYYDKSGLGGELFFNKKSWLQMLLMMIFLETLIKLRWVGM